MKKKNEVSQRLSDKVTRHLVHKHYIIRYTDTVKMTLFVKKMSVGKKKNKLLLWKAYFFSFRSSQYLTVKRHFKLKYYLRFTFYYYYY